MLAAPILHARTKYNDFPYGLLVIPEDFSPQDVQWARSYITQSTRYMELCGPQGRRVIFSNASVVVTGISIYISDLYTLCGKRPNYETVDQSRRNYAFIGLVIPKNEITNPFAVPYDLFLAQYEAGMERLWEMPYSNTGVTAAKAAYTQLPFLENAPACDIPNNPDERTRIVLDVDYAPREEICTGAAWLAKDIPEVAFCSDISGAVGVTESSFTIVTAQNAGQILAALARDAEKEDTPQPRDTGKAFPNPFRKKLSPKTQDALELVKNTVAKTWKAIPKAVKIGGLIVIALSSVASKKKD